MAIKLPAAGPPPDQNLYQCVKRLTAAEASAGPGAVLILCAEPDSMPDTSEASGDCHDPHRRNYGDSKWGFCDCPGKELMKNRRNA